MNIQNISHKIGGLSGLISWITVLGTVVGVSYFFGSLITKLDGIEKNQTEIKIELREIRTALEKIDDRLDKVEVRLEKVETNTNTLTFDLKAHRNSSEAHRRTTNIPEK